MISTSSLTLVHNAFDYDENKEQFATGNKFFLSIVFSIIFYNFFLTKIIQQAIPHAHPFDLKVSDIIRLGWGWEGEENEEEL